MKFKNFDIEDVLGADDIEEAEKHVGEIGYFEDSLEDLDSAITCYSKEIFKLIRIKQANSDNKYVVNDACSFKYFLPLNKIKRKKTEPTETKVTYRYRPFRTIAEVDELLAKDTVKHYCFVGSDLYLRYKAKPNITKHIEITNLEVDTNTNELRFINGFTPRHLTKNFDFKIAGRWLPFGVEVTENE